MPPRTQKAQSAKNLYQQICLICLKTDVSVTGIEEQLGYFYEDFCDFDYTRNRKMLFCEDCGNVLRKMYLIKKQCKAAIKLLTEWDNIDPKLRKPITDLSNQLINYDFTESDDDDYDYQSDELTDDQCETKTHLKTTKQNESVNKPGVLDEDEIKIEMDDNDSAMDALECHNNVTDNLNDVSDSQSDIADSQDDVIDSKTGILDSHNNVTDSLNDVSDNNNDIADRQDDVIDSKTGILDSHNNVTDSLNDVSDSHNDMSDSDKDTADSLKYENFSDDINDPDYIEITNKIESDSDDEMVDNFKDDIDLKDESVAVIVKNKENNKIINEPLKGIKITKKVKPKIKKETLITKEQYSKYQEVFDIVWFNNREEVLAEFAQRQFSDYYLNANYRCDVCFTVCKSQKCLDVHMRWHDPSAGDRICEICSMRFVGTRQLYNHKNSCHSGRFACKKCPLVTYRKNVMESHYKRHVGIEFMCKVCGTGFRNMSTKAEHVRREHGASHVCGACARAFLNVQGLRQHRIRVHKTRSLVEAEGEAKCDECDVIFTTMDVYNIHLKNTPIHKDKANLLNEREKHRKPIVRRRKKSSVNLTCKLCNATGTHPTWFYMHMLRVHPEVEYTSIAKRRRRLKKYLCDQCGRGFVSPGLLVQHKNMHSGARPFACQQCGARFCLQVYLRNHEEEHRPPTRECKHCGNKFTSAHHLANHMRRHITERPHKCALCGKGFVFKSAMNEHIKSVHQHIRKERKARGSRQVDTET